MTGEYAGLIDKARAEWNAVVSKWPTGLEILDGILAQYSTPARHYHNLEHIAEMTVLLDEYRNATGNWDDLLWATLYHDIIYDAQRSDNEEKSAERCAVDLTNLGMAPAQIAGIVQLILATRKHQLNSESAALKFFLDADLAILGGETPRYKRYAADVRKEYAHVAEADYRAGRSAVLKKFLERDRLYFTDALRERFEDQARHNLSLEIASLLT